MTTQLDVLSLTVDLLSRIKNVLDLSTTLDPIERRTNWQFADGAGADQVNVHWADERTIGASSSETLDLNGVLLDAFGAGFNLARVKILYIEADKDNTNDVEVGGAASNTWKGPFKDVSDIAVLKPKGAMLFVAPNAAGYVVTAGTVDQLKIANSGAGTSVKYRIYIAGSLT